MVQPRKNQGDHVIPAVLGEFEGEFLFKRICSKCNSRISKCEEQLNRCAPEAFFRHLLCPKVARSKRGSSWLGADGYPPPLPTIDRGDHHELVEMSPDAPHTVTAFDQLVVVGKDKRQIVIRLFPTMTAKHVGAQIDAAGFISGYEIFAHVSEEHASTYLALLAELLPKSRIEDRGTREPGISREEGRLDFRFNLDSYMRAIAKIAFHYYLTTSCRGILGNEPGFAELRRFIIEGGRSPQSLVDVNPKFRLPFTKDSPAKQWVHILAADEVTNEVYVSLSLFTGPNHLAPVHSLRLGRISSSLILPNAQRAHAYIYEAGTRSKNAGHVEQIKLSKFQ